MAINIFLFSFLISIEQSQNKCKVKTRLKLFSIVCGVLKFFKNAHTSNMNSLNLVLLRELCLKSYNL